MHVSLKIWPKFCAVFTSRSKVKAFRMSCCSVGSVMMFPFVGGDGSRGRMLR